MKHFKSILLSLMLVFTYSQAHAWVTIELGEAIDVTNKDECIKVIEKGTLLTTHTTTEGAMHHFSHLYKGFIYSSTFFDSLNHYVCRNKRSLGN
jgi:hypothetical protein